MWPFETEPRGFTLIPLNGQPRSTIRGDLIPPDTIVIIQDNISYVRTGRKDNQDFDTYEEGHKTYEYISL